MILSRTRLTLIKTQKMNSIPRLHVKVPGNLWNQFRCMSQLGDLGSGAGKGGGGGGSIREAGGAFGKMEAGREEEYFYRKQKEALHKLKDDLHSEINFHEEQIKRHQEAIVRHKKRVSDLDEQK